MRCFRRDSVEESAQWGSQAQALTLVQQALGLESADVVDEVLSSIIAGAPKSEGNRRSGKS